VIIPAILFFFAIGIATGCWLIERSYRSDLDSADEHIDMLEQELMERGRAGQLALYRDRKEISCGQ